MYKKRVDELMKDKQRMAEKQIKLFRRKSEEEETSRAATKLSGAVVRIESGGGE